MKCRNCNAPLVPTMTTHTPTCPHCGTWWPEGRGGAYIGIAAMVVFLIATVLLRSP